MEDGTIVEASSKPFPSQLTMFGVPAPQVYANGLFYQMKKINAYETFFGILRFSILPGSVKFPFAIPYCILAPVFG